MHQALLGGQRRSRQDPCPGKLTVQGGRETGTPAVPPSCGFCSGEGKGRALRENRGRSGSFISAYFSCGSDMLGVAWTIGAANRGSI